MRVIAGVLGGQRIDTPHGTAVRPTTDRVREAIFNSLGSLGVVDGAVVLDLFAGSGALGIEALSRGAESCTFIEQDRAVARVISDNIDRLGLGDRSTVRVGDSARLTAGLEADLVFADPPYGYDKWIELLSGLEASYVVLEADRAIDPRQIFAEEPSMAAHWRQIRAKRYGRTWVTFLERSDTMADD
jgi:16S rRNA (guanine966-N2)-methyltransferase